MARSDSDPAELTDAVVAVLAGAADRATTGLAVRGTLALLAKHVPGRNVEVRVPPYGAVQCVPGPRHRRGTPPAVVETDAGTWLCLAVGRITWAEAVAASSINASGERADLTPYLPVIELPAGAA